MSTISIKASEPTSASNITASQLILGTGSFLSTADTERAFSLLDAFVQLGGTGIDTARHYGQSEAIIGQWLQHTGQRHRLQLLTKGGHPSHHNPTQGRLSEAELIDDLDTSLATLGTDHVELYALHRDDRRVPVAEIMHWLHHFVTAGKVTALGASNWQQDRLDAANHYAISQGLSPFSFNSPGFSLAQSKRPRWPGCVSADTSLLEWHQQQQLPLLAWSPQGAGFFSGKYSPEKCDNQEMVEVYYSEDNWQRHARCQQLAKEMHIQPSQLALAYVLNQAFPSAAIIGARHTEHLQQAFAATQVKLSPQQVAWLNLA